MPPTKKRTTKKATTTTSTKKLVTPIWSTILYGPSGIGKTSLCGQLPNVAFVVDKREGGINRLAQAGIVPNPSCVRVAQNWNMLLNHLKADFPVNTKYVVIESITGCQQLLFDYVCEEEFGGDLQSFYAYYKGPDICAQQYWKELLDLLHDIVESDLNVILTGHSKVANETNPEGVDYVKHFLDCDKRIWSKTKAWAESIIFFNYKVTIDKSQRGLKSKAKSSHKRVLYTMYSPLYDAKNWFGLPEIIEAGSTGKEAATNLLDAFKGRKRESQ